MLNSAMMGMVYAAQSAAFFGATIKGLGGAITNAQCQWEEEEGMHKISSVMDGLRLQANGSCSSFSSSFSSGSITLSLGSMTTNCWRMDIIALRCIRIATVGGIR
jgi:hypothetical protein